MQNGYRHCRRGACDAVRKGAREDSADVMYPDATLDGNFMTGAPGRDRTCGTRIRNPALYPLSYGG